MNLRKGDVTGKKRFFHFIIQKKIYSSNFLHRRVVFTRYSFKLELHAMRQN